MNWYEEEVAELIRKRDDLEYQPKTVFYGSSTIRLWEHLYTDFKEELPVNLGFGGSTLEACVYFFDRIVAPLQGIEKLVVYAGDNDLGDGKSPDEVFSCFLQLRAQCQASFPNTPLYYISIKPSISRWNIDDNIRQTNSIIENAIQDSPGNETYIDIYNAMLTNDGVPNAAYYDADGLHLSNAGYEVWNKQLHEQIFNK